MSKSAPNVSPRTGSVAELGQSVSGGHGAKSTVPGTASSRCPTRPGPRRLSGRPRATSSGAGSGQARLCASGHSLGGLLLDLGHAPHLRAHRPPARTRFTKSSAVSQSRSASVALATRSGSGARPSSLTNSSATADPNFRAANWRRTRTWPSSIPCLRPSCRISSRLRSKAVTTVCIVVASSNSSLAIPFERNIAFTVRVKNRSRSASSQSRTTRCRRRPERGRGGQIERLRGRQERFGGLVGDHVEACLGRSHEQVASACVLLRGGVRGTQRPGVAARQFLVVPEKLLDSQRAVGGSQRHPRPALELQNEHVYCARVGPIQTLSGGSSVCHRRTDSLWSDESVDRALRGLTDEKRSPGHMRS